MIIRRLLKTKPLINSYHHSLLRHHTLTTESTHPQLASPTTDVNPDHLLRICTILYHQQNSPESRLNLKLSSFDYQLTTEFFLRVCNNFPLSWRPVHRFYLYTQTKPDFTHTTVTFNKLLDVLGKSRNIDLFWEVAQEIGKRKLANDKTFRVVLKTLASIRELKKCVNYFHLMNDFGYSYNLKTLNRVVETLCGDKLTEEAKFVVSKLNDWIKPDGVTYKLIIRGFCDVGDSVEASKIWNLMVDEGFEPDIDAVESMMEFFFKNNRYDEAMKMFQMMRVERIDDLGLSTYRLVVKWMCKRDKIEVARQLLDEMRQRGIQADNLTWSSVLYGLLAKRKVDEAYKVVEKIPDPDINIYNGFIKGLLRLKRPREATQVFREMISRRCEPTMHTYVMLLQGHLGQRGRKGPDPLVNFDTIFVGGLVKAGKSLEATKYVERSIDRGLEVPKFDYNKFLHYYSTEEGAVMFEEVSHKLREVGLFDLADVMQRYGEKMTTRERRRHRDVDNQTHLQE